MAARNLARSIPPPYAGVIAVTATDCDDKLFQGANRRTHMALAAPDVDLLLPAPEAAYQIAPSPRRATRAKRD
jgi:hypothetical protein